MQRKMRGCIASSMPSAFQVLRHDPWIFPSSFSRYYISVILEISIGIENPSFQFFPKWISERVLKIGFSEKSKIFRFTSILNLLRYLVKSGNKRRINKNIKIVINVNIIFYKTIFSLFYFLLDIKRLRPFVELYMQGCFS